MESKRIEYPPCVMLFFKIQECKCKNPQIPQQKYQLHDPIVLFEK